MNKEIYRLTPQETIFLERTLEAMEAYYKRLLRFSDAKTDLHKDAEIMLGLLYSTPGSGTDAERGIVYINLLRFYMFRLARHGDGPQEQNNKFIVKKFTPILHKMRQHWKEAL